MCDPPSKQHGGIRCRALSLSTRIGIALTILGYLAFGFAAWRHERGQWDRALMDREKAAADSAWGAGPFQPWRWKR